MSQTRVGEFVVEERLDGAARTYRVSHAESGRPAVIKFLSRRLANSPASRQELIREIEGLKSLTHPNLVRCFGGGRHEVDPYLVYEFVEGESINWMLSRRGRLPWELVVDYGKQIAAALHVAHEKGFTHGELTPERLILAKDGSIKIMDVRRLRGDDEHGGEWTQRRPAELAYVAPERVNNRAARSVQSDLYSLGCIMYEMLTSHPPFVGETAAEMLAAHQKQTPSRVGVEILDCPVWLDLLIGQLLEKDPRKRPKTAAVVYYALKETEKRMSEGGSVSAHAMSGSGPGFNPLRVKVDPELKKIVKPKKKPREIGEKPAFYERAWFLLLCLLLVAGGVAWLLWPLNEDQLFARAQKLMKDPEQHEVARSQYLEPLLKRFPNSKHQGKAQEFLDLIETDKAANKVRNKVNLGRKPTCEGQRLCAEAFTMEEFGDQETALEKYEAIVELIKPEGEDAQYVKLAMRKIKEIKSSPQKAPPREEFLKNVLDGIENLLLSGDREKARERAESVISLYSGNKTLEPFVKRAEEILRLIDSGEKPKQRENSDPAASEPPF
jgi:hypothetical protein